MGNLSNKHGLLLLSLCTIATISTAESTMHMRNLLRFPDSNENKMNAEGSLTLSDGASVQCSCTCAAPTTAETAKTEETAETLPAETLPAAPTTRTCKDLWKHYVVNRKFNELSQHAVNYRRIIFQMRFNINVNSKQVMLCRLNQKGEMGCGIKLSASMEEGYMYSADDKLHQYTEITLNNAVGSPFNIQYKNPNLARDLQWTMESDRLLNDADIGKREYYAAGYFEMLGCGFF